MKGGNRLFRARPARLPAGELAALLAENPSVLGPGWKTLGRGESPEEKEALLLAAPEGELVICLAAPELDPRALARGRILLEEARRALGFLGRFRIPGWPLMERVRLLLVGGTAAAPLLSAAGGEVTILLVSRVEGQPGPPLVVSEPPLEEFSPGEPAGPLPGETRPEEAFPEAPLEDGEVERLISRLRNP